MEKNIRYLEILKYLHSGSKTGEEISAHFNISERSLNDGLNTLQNGFKFMGTSMRINNYTNRENTYESPIHPIFLALNSAQIYAMTIGLKLLSQDTVFGHALSDVANDVYTQLSVFAKELLERQPEFSDTLFDEDERIRL